MTAVCLIDTSIFTNILNVPKCNQHRTNILDQYEKFIMLDYEFILPMATILETGNHIAHYGDGNQRREVAQIFIKAVQDAFKENPPYRISQFDKISDILDWLPDFPEMAMRGIGFGDLTITKEFEKTCKQFQKREVFIWSLDKHLESYHQNQKT